MPKTGDLIVMASLASASLATLGATSIVSGKHKLDQQKKAAGQNDCGSSPFGCPITKDSQWGRCSCIGPHFVVQRFVMPPQGLCYYRCPIRLHGDPALHLSCSLQWASCCVLGGSLRCLNRSIATVLMAFGVRLVSHVDDAVLPVGVHDFADAIGRCILVDKTMFIADVLDCDASVVVCCRPEGFGKSMNLSMLRAFLERPAVGRAGRISFADAQIWDADGGRYRDEYACYPVISLDFSGATRRGAAIAGVVRDALSGECARLLALLEAPDLARDKVRHIERVARGAASEDEVASVLGVLIELLEIACDEQVVLLVDGYDAACVGPCEREGRFRRRSAGLFDRVLFDAIATARDSLRLTCLMGECPGPAEAALSLHCCSYCLTTPLSTWCDRWFGFSDAEVEALLNHAGREEYLDDAREWLEGYRFGMAYCSSPERVIGFLGRGCTAPVRADLYGYADCLSRVVAGWNLDRLSVLFDLLEAHGCAEVPLCLGTAEPDVSPDDGMWTALYLSGFLTTDMTEEPEDGDCLRALRLPNNELRQALRLVIIEWFECAAEDIRDVDAFRDGLCHGNEDTVRRALSRILGDVGIGATDPDTPLPYHLLLQGLCFGLPGYANPAPGESVARIAGTSRFFLRACVRRSRHDRHAG